MDRSCTSCDRKNREDRRFCSRCGVTLGIVCTRCCFFNEKEDQFCGGCGASVLPSDSVQGIPPAVEVGDNNPPAQSTGGATAKGFDMAALVGEARQYRKEIEQLDEMDQGEIDALFSESP